MVQFFLSTWNVLMIEFNPIFNKYTSTTQDSCMETSSANNKNLLYTWNILFMVIKDDLEMLEESIT